MRLQNMERVDYLTLAIELARANVPKGVPMYLAPAPESEDELLSGAEHDVWQAVMDFTDAVKHADTERKCRSLHHRLSGLVMALGVIEDQALLKAEDLKGES